MILKHQPFAACAQLVSVARGAVTLQKGARGAGVRLLQGGLLDVGYKMPGSIQKAGAPDGIFGLETTQVITKFQGTEKLKVDGVVGKATMMRLDALAAKKASTPPPVPPPAIPSAAVSVDYMLGLADPPHPPDPGAGPWNSRSTEASYLALRSAIAEVLPASIPLVGDDAVAHMWHYLNCSGRPYTIDLAGMIKEVPSAKDDYGDEVAQAKRFVEGLPVGKHDITSRNVEASYNKKFENQNWYYAIGGYKRWGTGQATVQQDPQGRSYVLDYTYRFYDRYNWDGGKSVTLFGVTITDYFMGEFHRQGIAREFDCHGSVRRRFTWKHGEKLSAAQLTAPVTSERGA
jgi:peptidoglycan hydrolase-like protein with peptidoglycan-binding domain